MKNDVQEITEINQKERGIPDAIPPEIALITNPLDTNKSSRYGIDLAFIEYKIFMNTYTARLIPKLVEIENPTEREPKVRRGAIIVADR